MIKPLQLSSSKDESCSGLFSEIDEALSQKELYAPLLYDICGGALFHWWFTNHR